MKKIDYVEFYAEKLKQDNSIFEQQRNLIESQLESSSLLFKNAFGQNFKKNARKYLKDIGLV